MDKNLETIIWDNKDIPIEPMVIKKVLLKHCCIGHSSTMIRRRIIEIVGGYDEHPDYKFIEDYELWLRISRQFKIANLPKTLLYHREHEEQVSKIFSALQRTNADKLREKYQERLNVL